MTKQGLAVKVAKAAFNVLAFVAKTLARLIVFTLKIVWTLLTKAITFISKRIAQPAKPANENAFKEVSTVSGAVKNFEDFLYSNRSTIGIILGGRGSGKSALGLRVLENVKANGRKVCAMGFLEESLPQWIKCVNTPEVENGSFLLVDEGGLSFSSRESFSDANKLLSRLLLVSRHKDVSVLFISQNSANIDVNALRQADYLLLKKPALLQHAFERKEMNKLYEKVSEEFKKYSFDKRVFYCYSDAFEGFALGELPSFWSEKTSKAFARKNLSKANSI